MSHPAVTAPTQIQAALKDFREAGVVFKAPRLFLSKRMKGFNAEVYSSWIARWATNAAANYPVVKGAMGVAFLKNAAKDIPAVCVGIGPSLDDEIETLKTAPRHAVVISTDAAFRPLQRHGIKPDIVLNFDARDEQPTMWETIDTSESVLLANSCTSPHTIEAWHGKTMFFNMEQSDDEFCSNVLPILNPYIGGLPNMGTVGNGAVYLARYMGCKPIIGVGMDLCYKQDLRLTNGTVWHYRCRDYVFIRNSPDFPEGQWIETENKTLYDNSERFKDTFDDEIKGKTYRVDKPLQFYRNSLVSNVGQMDLPLINCSGGVMTDLVESMTLKEALEKYCFATVEPGRTIMKHLFKLVPAPNKDWRLWKEARLFVPSETLRPCIR